MAIGVFGRFVVNLAIEIWSDDENGGLASLAFRGGLFFGKNAFIIVLSAFIAFESDADLREIGPNIVDALREVLN